MRIQNPYGMISVVLSIVAFLFPQYGTPLLTLLFCIITYCTFEPEKEDNRAPFFIGMFISLLGILMFFQGATHAIFI